MMPMRPNAASSPSQDSRVLTSSAGRVAVGHPIDVATGTLFQDIEDYVVPGRVPVSWSRRYSSALVQAEVVGMFGPGWAGSYEMRLCRDLDGYTMIAEDGETVVTFDDRRGVIEAGETVRNPGAFHEIQVEGSLLLVTKWIPEAHEIRRFRFEPTDVPDTYRLRSKESIDGQAVEIAYDRQGRIVRLRQRREGRELRLIYNDRDRVSYVYLLGRELAAKLVSEPGPPIGRLIRQYCYDEGGRLTEAIDAIEQRFVYTYDDAGRLIREVTPGGMVYHFRYDAEGRCVESTGLDGFARTTLKIDTAARLTQVTDSLGHTTTYTWNTRGQVEKRIFPSGFMELYTYDSIGRLIRSALSGGRIIDRTYDERGDLIEYAEGERTSSIEYQYNNQHQLLTSKDPAGYVWHRHYHANGLVQSIVDPCDHVTSMEYDALGDLMEIREGDADVYRYQWDRDGHLIRMIEPSGNNTYYEYTDEGLLAKITVGEHSTYIWRDALGRVSKMHFPNGAIRKYHYHPTDQVSQLIDENQQVYSWQYSPCGLLLKEIRPDNGTVRFEWSTEPEQLLKVIREDDAIALFEYNVDGLISASKDFHDHWTYYKYDRFLRTVSEKHNEQELSYIYKDANRSIEVTCNSMPAAKLNYDVRGLLVFSQFEDVTLERRYSPVGSLLWERQQGKYEISYEYDKAGQKSAKKSSHGVSCQYKYGLGGRLAAILFGDIAEITFKHDSDGNEILRRSSPGGVSIESRYDMAGRVRESIATVDRTVLLSGIYNHNRSLRFSAQYEYDVSDRLRRWIINDEEYIYEYDKTGRICASKVPYLKKNERITYDIADNIRKIEDEESSKNFFYSTSGTLQALDSEVFVYNSKGQLVRSQANDTVRLFYWNAQDLLSAIETPQGRWEYKYDALGRRVSKIGPASRTDYVWDGNVILHEVTTQPQRLVRVTQWEFSSDDFSPIGMLNLEEKQLYMSMNDCIGRPISMISDSGIEWQARYKLFGGIDHEQARKQDARCPVRFQGQWYDPESGLCYNRFRYYDSRSGRYISPDPIGIAGALNIYSYVLDPLGWLDPLGLDWNYRLRAANQDIYYYGRASDNESIDKVAARHAGTQGNDGTRFVRGSDTIEQITPKGTSKNVARGIEDAGIKFGGPQAQGKTTNIGRRKDNGNRVRGNNIGGISVKNKKGKTYRSAAKQHLTKKGVTCASSLPVLDSR